MSIFPRAALVLAICVLTACAAENLSAPPTPIGDFQLGFNSVVADQAQSVGPSRKATPDEWEAAFKQEIGKRIGRYSGNRIYHLGVGVTAYALAVPGVPILLSPKSVVVFSVDVWDDALQRTVNAEPKEFTVFEGISGATVIGSGLTKSREQQIATLSENAARKIGEWLVENKAWFTPEAIAARSALPPLPKPAAGTVSPSTATAAPPAVTPVVPTN